MKKSSIILCLALILLLSLIPGVFAESISISPQASEGIAGEEMELTIMIDRVPEGLSGYNITVAVENPQIAEIVNVSYPGWVAFSYIYPPPPASYANLRVSDLTDAIRPGDRNVELGYIMVRGLNQGSTAIAIDVIKLDTESGDAIKPITSGATITVISGSVPGSTGGTGGGSAGSGIFGSSITISATMTTAASSTPVETAATPVSTSPATTAPGEEATAQQTGAVESGDAGQTASVSETGTGEGDFPWLIIVGAFVAVVLVGLAAIGYNKSREKS